MSWEWIERHRRRGSVVAALVLPCVVAAAMVPFRATFANAAAALVLVAVVVAVAVLGTRSAGYLASFSSAAWFDFFLTRPYDQFTINRRPDVEAAVCIFLVGLIVTELAARNRHHFKVLSEESNYIAALRDLTELAVGGASASDLVERAADELVDVLSLRGCRFETVSSEPPRARLAASGEVEHVGLLWPVEELGIPGPEAEIVVQWHGRALGRFVLTPTPGHPVSEERRVAAVALANVVAAALADERRMA
jgi:K+-sensing histidine kinase KdpD